MGTETQLVKVEHLYKEFDENTKVLEDINLTINKNEVIAILGPSGTGKSTLLRCLNYLTVPTKGKITIGDVTVDAQNHTKKDVIELRKHSSMVFQGYNLFKNKTALENVMEALTVVQKKSKAEAEKIALELLDKVGMSERKDFYPSKLSGGQQQRVGIARALAVNPNVVLFDEPTSALSGLCQTVHQTSIGKADGSKAFQNFQSDGLGLVCLGRLIISAGYHNLCASSRGTFRAGGIDVDTYQYIRFHPCRIIHPVCQFHIHICGTGHVHPDSCVCFQLFLDSLCHFQSNLALFVGHSVPGTAGANVISAMSRV